MRTLVCGQIMIKAKADVHKSNRNNKRNHPQVCIYLNLSLKKYEMLGKIKHEALLREILLIQNDFDEAIQNTMSDCLKELGKF